MPVNTMTPRQRGFLETLLRERQLNDAQETSLRQLLDRADVPRQDASRMIDAMMALPKKAAAAARPAGGGARVHPLEGLPKAKYALTEIELPEAARGNDLSFWEIKEYMGTVYLRQLHGAPGSFSRTKVSWDMVKEVAALLKLDPIAASLRFGRHYSVCGKCAAELTVERSRELGFGPHCARELGLEY